MIFNIRGSKIEVTDSIKNYIENKIGKLTKYFSKDIEININVTIKVRGIDQIVEVTIYVDKLMLRAEEVNKDLYAAVDLVYEKLERQIRKNKTKAKKNIKQSLVFDDFEVDLDEDIDNDIVKRKIVDTKPMSEEEAILQMELIDHDFFLFNNDSTNTLCVVYKRKDNTYGILETK